LRRLARAVPVAALALASTACAGAAPAARGGLVVDRGPAEHAEAHWEPLFTPTPDVFIVVRPQALLGDAAYGPVLRGALALAREKSHLVASAGPAEVLEGADEVLVAARDRGDPAEVDVIAVVRGVPAEVDPARLVDEAGHFLWVVGPTRPSPDVTELWRAPRSGQGSAEDADDADASLFELPGRTWVLAAGAARARARDVLSRPDTAVHRVEGDEKGALALVRMRGTSLVRRVQALRSPALLSPIGHALDAVTLALARGDGSIQATLSYKDRPSVDAAEATVKDALRAFAEHAPPADDDAGPAPQGEPAKQATRATGATQNRGVSAWLRGATVDSSPCCVVVSIPAPRP
jgi:hypothetical protein